MMQEAVEAELSRPNEEGWLLPRTKRPCNTELLTRDSWFSSMSLLTVSHH